MFDHSVKVPRLYKTAAKIARDVFENKGSIKQLVYEGKHPNIKALYALVVQTFQKALQIDDLLKKSKLLTKETRFDEWLAKILITELLWGKGRLMGESKPVKTILAYEQTLKAHMSDNSAPQTENFENNQVEKPRYVRINTLLVTINEAIDKFRDEGWILKRFTNKNNYPEFLEAISTLNSDEFMVDLHLPDLLVFPPKTQFYQHPAYKNGSIILQDKASCFPVHMLNPEPGSVILDMCAAPGMKTTQLAAKIQNEGIIYATEIKEKRFKTLTQICESSGATCIKPINRDVLTMTHKDCPDVKYILVDPSCSGSGITDRVEVGAQKRDEDPRRLEKLAGFQAKILRYALTKFHKATRVVYSTCSNYPEENEDVVRQVLESSMFFKLVPAAPLLDNAWLNYGSSDFGTVGEYCLYARPEIDLTNGFFVAVFERLKEGECNEFLDFERMQTNRAFLKKGEFDESVESKKNYSNEEYGEDYRDCENEYNKKNKRNQSTELINENSSAREQVMKKENVDSNETQKKKKAKNKKHSEEEIQSVQVETNHLKDNIESKLIASNKEFKNNNKRDSRDYTNPDLIDITHKNVSKKRKRRKEESIMDKDSIKIEEAKLEFYEDHENTKSKKKNKITASEVKGSLTAEDFGLQKELENSIKVEEVNLEAYDVEEKLKKKPKKKKMKAASEALTTENMDGKEFQEIIIEDSINIEEVKLESYEVEEKSKKISKKKKMKATPAEDALTTGSNEEGKPEFCENDVKPKKKSKTRKKLNLEEVDLTIEELEEIIVIDEDEYVDKPKKKKKTVELNAAIECSRLVDKKVKKKNKK